MQTETADFNKKKRYFFYILMFFIFGWFFFMQLFGTDERHLDQPSGSIFYTGSFTWEKPDGSRYGRACRGCYVLSASSPFAPGVVDRALSPIRSPGDLYPGCYGRASLYFRRAGGVRGVAVELGNLQKLEDGERLDRAGLAADDFDDGYARDGTRC